MIDKIELLTSKNKISDLNRSIDKCFKIINDKTTLNLVIPDKPIFWFPNHNIGKDLVQFNIDIFNINKFFDKQIPQVRVSHTYLDISKIINEIIDLTNNI